MSHLVKSGSALSDSVQKGRCRPTRQGVADVLKEYTFLSVTETPQVILSQVRIGEFLPQYSDIYWRSYIHKLGFKMLIKSKICIKNYSFCKESHVCTLKPKRS